MEIRIFPKNVYLRQYLSRFLIVYLFFLIFCSSILQAQLFFPVIDEVGVVSFLWKEKKNHFLIDLYQKTGVQIQIYVARDTQGESIESFSIKLVEKLKLGDEKTDKGLLLLLVPSQRAARIEVGQGLEGDLPDVMAKRILEFKMIPFFKKEQYELGLDVGLNQILEVLNISSFNSQPFKKSNTDQVLKKSEQTKKKFKISSENLLIVHFHLIVLILIINYIKRKLGIRTDVGWGMGGGGIGGGWSGGGGGFSGGGATGRW